MGHPAFDEGMKACQLGKGLHHNPYPIGTMDHKEWANGHYYASSVASDEF